MQMKNTKRRKIKLYKMAISVFRNNTLKIFHFKGIGYLYIQ